ncbi:myc box-dependent-interacting protein 1-like isoform X2 [Tachypleus tridentatus]|uniref:myc box-dependent-interacting protein 1-like isoform X2 n=1 Tax=Tachypleus tridentatus TaxID=6853 RepID=UPI003FD06FBF
MLHYISEQQNLLQNLGKADKTTDELFDIYVNNFNKQQNSANKLHKEFKNYLTSVRALQTSSKSLMDTLSEIYEQEWIGHEQVPVQSQKLETMMDDFCHKLNDQVTIPLTAYMNQFPDVRAKIAKRGRKMVDYDSARHHLETLLNVSKKRDEVKMTKAKEQLDESKLLYETLNKELHEELPALYDSRIAFLVSNLQTYFHAESVFHTESAQVFTNLSSLMEELAEENQKGGYSSRQPELEALSLKDSSDARHEKCTLERNDHAVTNGEMEVPTTPVKSGFSNSAKEEQIHPLTSPTTDSNKSMTDHIDTEKDLKSEKLEEKVLSTENHVEIPPGATTTSLPPGVYYRVQATYKYTAEDVDELSFEANDIISVVAYDDPEEQEEGWLMGVKESTQERGIFPANFTRPI